jgi:hypothetical protein
VSKFIDLTGDVFGKLRVMKAVWSEKHKQTCWECLCDCGNLIVRRGSDLRGGKIKSCGCYNRETLKERAKNRNTRHGMYGTRQYEAWRAMMKRCYNKKCDSYKYYGERGISVCEKWHSFNGFWDDMKNGYQDDLTLERKDNNKGYHRDNCRWATIAEQNVNKRSVRQITYNGKTQTIVQWSKDLNINYGTLISRIYKGWPIEKALSTPV